MAATAVPYSDSESASDAPCVAPQQEQSTRQRRVVTGVVAAAALMATGAAVTVTKRANSSVQVDGALSAATTVTTIEFEMSDMGCSDWETQKIGDYFPTTGPQACLDKCNAEPLCMFANYMDQNCPDNGEWCAGTSSGSCYMFKGCTFEYNKYWNLYPSNNNPTTPCSTISLNTGCANWHSIQMAPYPNEPFVTATEEDCYDACAATPDCKYGNWQKIENDKCPDDEPLGFPYASQQGKGACYMFNGECTGSKSTGSTGIGEENVCWNLCSKVSSTTTTTL